MYAVKTKNSKQTNNLRNKVKCTLSKNTLQEVSNVIMQSKEIAEKSNIQFVKLKDNTIKLLVDYGVKNLPML